MSTLSKTRNSIPEAARTKVTAILNQNLADLSDLYSQTKQAHWNVRGRAFYQQHLLFDALAERVEVHLDTLAERISSLGGYAKGTIRQAASSTKLPEFPASQGDELGFIVALIERYALAANEVRSGIDETDKLGDKDSADLLTSISRDLDENLWMLEAHTREL